MAPISRIAAQTRVLCPTPARCLDEIAQAALAGLELADHRADRGERHRHLQPHEDLRHGRGQAHLAERLPAGGVQRAGQLGEVGGGAGQAGRGGEHDREEAEQEDHRQDRGLPPAQGDHQQRPDGDLRNRVHRDQQRHEHPLQHVGRGESEPDQGAERGGEQEADHHLLGGDRRVLQQPVDRVPELGPDGARRRQHQRMDQLQAGGRQPPAGQGDQHTEQRQADHAQCGEDGRREPPPSGDGRLRRPGLGHWLLLENRRQKRRRVRGRDRPAHPPLADQVRTSASGRN